MERGPSFQYQDSAIISDFSKESNQAGRDETAAQIADLRREKEAVLLNKELVSAKATELRQKIEAIESNWLSKWIKKGELSDKKLELADLEDYLATVPLDQLERAKATLDNFYQREGERWRSAGYEREDVERYFSEEYLSSLSLEEYVVLLQRFKPEILTHVTRYGVRDHSAMMEHRGGLGEFLTSFTNLLQDGRMRSVIGKIVNREDKEVAFREYFDYILDQIRKHAPWVKDESDQQVLSNYFARMMTNSSFGGLPDVAAVHFGLESALDDFYGGETGNEIFFVYPVPLILNQGMMSGRFQRDVDKNNNAYVWENDFRGIDINSSVVFIAKDAKVDPATGSIYQTDQDKGPVVSQARIDKLASLINDDKFWRLISELNNQSVLPRMEAFSPIELEAQIREQGIDDWRLIGALSDRWKISTLYNHMNNKRNHPEFIHQTDHEAAASFLFETLALYEYAKEPVPSMEFWERYWQQHPEQKPSKIVYYEGDPNCALQRWRIDNQMMSYGDWQKREKIYEQFSDKLGEPTAQLDRLRDEISMIGQEVIAKYYSQ
jgi:hypothetical protein